MVFAHFIRDADHPVADPIQPLTPGQLKVCFSGFQSERYEEFDGIGEWGGPGSRLVRMIAQK